MLFCTNPKNYHNAFTFPTTVSYQKLQEIVDSIDLKSLLNNSKFFSFKFIVNDLDVWQKVIGIVCEKLGFNSFIALTPRVIAVIRWQIFINASRPPDEIVVYFFFLVTTTAVVIPAISNAPITTTMEMMIVVLVLREDACRPSFFGCDIM